MQEIKLGRRALFLGAAAVAVSGALPISAAHAAGGSSGPRVSFAAQGNLGEIIVNPYRIAPLTAIIRNGGYEITEATVRIVPKKDGQEIKYKVSRSELLTHGGVPVFGLYPDYNNTVEVSFTRKFHGKTEKFNDTYKIYTAPVYHEVPGTKAFNAGMFETKVNKVDKKFSDRLYLVNNLMQGYAKAARAVWNNPVGGALEWNFYPMNAIIDTKGEVRWYMHVEPIYDVENMYKTGIMMGFQQDKAGNLTWGYGQRYVKYDLMGREIYSRRLPINYADFSHSLDNAQNGHSFMRVASSDLRRADGKRVHTVRDLIVEVDENGKVVDEWRLWEILDPYRDNVMKVLDQGAVCLNIDASQAGKTLSAADLAKLDASDDFGDVVGTGPGRNWAHVNSVDYDPSDDSIIISSRHQSAIIKIGRDKKIKWMLSSPEGWKTGWKEKLLTPVKDGKKLACEGSTVEGDFDYTWTQHTAYRIDEKSDKNVIYITAFDNGDARGMEQPALPEMKYSRAVIYRIDQKKMTVEQVWEYGKDRGNDWYSPVTSLTKYFADKDSVMVYSATAGMGSRPEEAKRGSSPFIEEFKWGEKEPAVEIQLINTMGYQAMPIDIKKVFGN
ncbi:MAG: aryl-sulfate sulfotransferase [Sutterellaceae bacterium]|nr:aryl-sulfate sulfotransferase [Sutterellaceae bacterium]